MTIEIACVPPEKVKILWPRVSGLIFIAMKRGDLGSFHKVQEELFDGDMLLWLAIENRNDILSAAITQIQETEWRKVCVIVACGGSDMQKWLGLLSEIEKYAKAEGCSRTRIFGRRGWENVLPAYRPFRVVLDKDL